MVDTWMYIFNECILQVFELLRNIYYLLFTFLLLIIHVNSKEIGSF